ncbi:ash family protein, partial [Escherichia coli]
IAAAPGTAVLLIRLRFSTACSRPFMAIHPPFSGDG